MTDRALQPTDALAQLSFLVTGLLEARAAQHGLSLVQTRMLGVLRDRTLTMNRLAQRLELDKSSVTGLVARAERRGLVARTRSTDDRRSVTVGLTEVGRGLAAAGEAEFTADVTALLGRLPASERVQLTGLISRLLVAEAEAQGIDLFAAD